MASVCKHVPATPRAAGRRRAALDRLLDPELFKAMAEPTRARILACLIKCGRACSVSEVAECCSVDFSVVARHLGALQRVGLLESSKEGRVVWHRARSGELAQRLRAMAEAVEEWNERAAECDDCGCAGGAKGGG